MELPHPLQQGRFIDRPNRFACTVQLQDGEAYCHLPNPGRLEEFLRPGVDVWVADRRDVPGRRTSHDLLLVRHGDTLVSLDSRAPNALFEEALHAGFFGEFGECSNIRREVARGESRLDALITCETGKWLVEVKSCTLVAEGIARFPDAPTARGERHVRELAAAQGGGLGAAVVFVIQRDDAQSFAPHEEMDAEFTTSLRQAARKGVQVFAVACEVSRERIVPVERLPVNLTG